MSEPLPHPLLGGRFASPVEPGSGWPDDVATPATPVARDPADVERQAADAVAADALAAGAHPPGALAAGAHPADAASLADLTAQISVCRACPRLVEWRETVAHDKRRSFAGEPYWGRPVPGWGSDRPRVLIVGLAPAAHGGNRTGRMFTGDRSGLWLYGAMNRVGLAATDGSEHAGDGQRLTATRIVAAVRCAPPDNRPTTAERDSCAPWLRAELALVLPTVRAVVALGSYGFDAFLRGMRALGGRVPSPRPRFTHGVEAAIETADGRSVTLLASFHPSQQNTFTGRLTEDMLDAVLARARSLADA
ncbi:MAG TPA: uracil-DNA glycosylase [Nocardioidaceae bacterium]|nr:uracil-DNA glycosylase [Nocardioidaceae bacterium]